MIHCWVNQGCVGESGVMPAPFQSGLISTILNKITPKDIYHYREQVQYYLVTCCY